MISKNRNRMNKLLSHQRLVKDLENLQSVNKLSLKMDKFNHLIQSGNLFLLTNTSHNILYHPQSNLQKLNK